MLKVDEGFRSEPYLDTLGYPTVGYGEKLSNTLYEPLLGYSSVTQEEALEFVRGRIRTLYDQIDGSGWIKPHQGTRSAVWVCMAYQLGVRGLNGFVQTNKEWNMGDYEDCADNMLLSRWAQQTPERALRYANIIRGGELCQYYQV